MQLLLLYFVAFLFCFSHSEKPKVSLKYGTLFGIHKKVNDAEISVFLGVPYAKPPVENLRFQKPRPLTEPWVAKTWQADKWPNACWQENDLELLSEKSEDCLYLNIWTPTVIADLSRETLKPVIVWFHGGGYLNGSSSYSMFDGSALSAIGEVVVVTVNYRLGVFGFLYGAVNEAPGNMGLYDQALALEWVKDNIAYFGGNSDLVTIMGESAGGKAVTHHLSSPFSEKLFKNAVVMSGAGMTYLSVQPKNVAFQNSQTLATLVNCEVNAEDNYLSRNTIDCLRKVSAEDLINAQFNPKVNLNGKNPFRTAFFPISEEDYIPEPPENLWTERKFARNKSVLIGTVPNEGMVTFYLSVLREGKNKKELIEILEEFFDKLVPKELSIVTEDVIQLYFSSISEEDTFASRKAFFETLSDAFYICPSIIFAEKYSSVNQLYQYVFAYDSVDSRVPCHTFGPCHANDVPFVFGTVENEKDVKISVEWIRILSDFARNGKTKWSPYYKTKSNVLVASFYEFKGRNKNEQKVAYKSFVCEFWKSMIFSKYLR